MGLALPAQAVGLYRRIKLPFSGDEFIIFVKRGLAALGAQGDDKRPQRIPYTEIVGVCVGFE